MNLQINKEELLLFISNSEPIRIEGFQTKERTFGSLTCYKVKIKDIDAAIVIPERTRHEESMIELIAPVNLKDELSLKENDKVKLS